MTKYILTSPTGNLGSRALSSILEHNLIPPSDLIITTSSLKSSHVPSTAKPADIEIRTGVNFTQAPDQIAPGFNAIEAAVLAGVQMVIYTSLMFGGDSGMESVAGVQQAHIKTIEYLEEVKEKCKQEAKAFDFIVVREGIYAESWWLYAGYQSKVLTKGVLEEKVKEGNGKWEWVVPNDGKVAWVGWDDLGEATARIIAKHKEFLGQTVRLTGPRATSVSEVANIAAEEVGVKVDVRFVGKEAAQDWHLQRKSAGEGGDWVIESWVGWFDGLKDHECAVVDSLLAHLIGRQPEGVEEMRKELYSVRD